MQATKRIVLLFVAVGWFPLVLGELLSLAFAGHSERLFQNPSVHARLLLAVPAFLIADGVFSSRTSMCVGQLCDGRLVAQGTELVGVVLATARRKDSWVAEAVFLLLSIAVGQVAIWSGRAGLLSSIPADRSAGLLWYGFVSLPIFLFLLARSFWRWGCWSLLLWKTSRLRLQLVPMHADRAGGLGFLVGPSLAMGIVLLGSSAVIAAGFAERMESEGTQLAAFGPEVLLFVVLGELVALGPLLPFGPQLLSTRFVGIQDYGALGIDYARAFHRRWIEPPTREGLLGTSDIQSLADIQNAFRTLGEMRPAPFGKREMLLVCLAIFLPMLPLFAIAVPIDELLARLFSAIA